MSADSDSDICDLFSDFSKKAAKAEDRFWKNFATKSEETSKPNDTEVAAPSCSEEISVSELPAAESGDVMVLSDESNSKEGTASPKVEETTEVVLTSINNRIDDISEKVREILEGPRRGRGRRGRGRRSGKGEQQAAGSSRRRRKPNLKDISQSIVLSDDDIDEVKLVPVEINPVISIKVLWKSVETHTFQLRKFDKLTPIKDYYVNNKQADPQLLFFTLDNKEFQLENNSFVSLRLTDDKIIEGSVLPKTYLNKVREFWLDPQYDYNFKVQINSRRSKPFRVKCKSSDKMEIVFWQVLLETGQNIDDIKLYFDGTLLKPDDKILSLDLENGDCFDLILLRS